jgi:hypothetical protein
VATARGRARIATVMAPRRPGKVATMAAMSAKGGAEDTVLIRSSTTYLSVEDRGRAAQRRASGAEAAAGGPAAGQRRGGAGARGRALSRAHRADGQRAPDRRPRGHDGAGVSRAAGAQPRVHGWRRDPHRRPGDGELRQPRVSGPRQAGAGAGGRAGAAGAADAAGAAARAGGLRPEPAEFAGVAQPRGDPAGRGGARGRRPREHQRDLRRGRPRAQPRAEGRRGDPGRALQADLHRQVARPARPGRGDAHRRARADAGDAGREDDPRPRVAGDRAPRIRGDRRALGRRQVDADGRSGRLPPRRARAAEGQRRRLLRQLRLLPRGARLRATGRHLARDAHGRGRADLHGEAAAAGRHHREGDRGAHRPGARGGRDEGAPRAADLRPLGRAAQAGLDRLGADRRPEPVLPRRADLGPRPGPREADDVHAALPGRLGAHGGAGDARDREHHPVRPGRVHGRRSPGLLRAAGGGAAAVRGGQRRLRRHLHAPERPRERGAGGAERPLRGVRDLAAVRGRTQHADDGRAVGDPVSRLGVLSDLRVGPPA